MHEIFSFFILHDVIHDVTGHWIHGCYMDQTFVNIVCMWWQMALGFCLIGVAARPPITLSVHFLAFLPLRQAL